MPKSEDRKKQNTRYRPFEEAREYARLLGLNTQKEWLAFVRGEISDLPPKPNDIPENPSKIYPKFWKCYDDWIRRPSSWRSFEDAREYVRSLKLKSRAAWRRFIKGKLPSLGTKPNDIPDFPGSVYKPQWRGFDDWLGVPSKHWLPFEDARKYARSLNLTSKNEWKMFLKGMFPDIGSKPDDIPGHPGDIYKFQGWCGFNDWLGVPSKRWHHFKRARQFARSLSLQTVKEWRLFCRGKMQQKGIKPKMIPASPDTVYKNKGWKSWNDWLGNELIEKNKKIYEPFVEARRYARLLNLTTPEEWFAYCKGNDIDSPDGLKIPILPYSAYKDSGWTSWKDWLGAFCNEKDIRSYKDAKKFVRALKLKSSSEWRQYCRGYIFNKPYLPNDIPALARRTYKNKGDWVSWEDFLGCPKVMRKKRKKFKPFEEAREFARALNLNRETDWRRYCRGELPEKGLRPDDIPALPHRVYKNSGWVSSGDWLGTGNIANAQRIFKPYDEAVKFARRLELNTMKEWQAYAQGKTPEKPSLPGDIPVNPYISYKNKGWISWIHFLGTEEKKKESRFRSFEEARKFARSLTLKDSKEWSLYSAGKLKGKGRRPKDIPAAPNTVYKNEGWKGFGDFLGTGRLSPLNRNFKSFKGARTYVRGLGLKSIKEWRLYRKGEFPEKGFRPSDIPSAPDEVYRNKGWNGWIDWLGKE